MKKNVDQAWLEEPWFDALKPQQKLAWFYVWVKSDLVGVWSGNRRIADIQIGYEIKWDDFLKALGGRVKVLESGKWWLTEYCPFQFGIFSPESRVHMAAKRTLNAHGIKDEDSLWIAYPEPTNRLTSQSHGHSQEEGSSEGKPKARGTVEQIHEFFSSEHLPRADAEWFFNKCVGNGWMNNGKPIKDWKATVRAWRAAHYLPSQKNGSNGNSTPIKGRV